MSGYFTVTKLRVIRTEESISESMEMNCKSVQDLLKTKHLSLSLTGDDLQDLWKTTRHLPVTTPHNDCVMHAGMDETPASRAFFDIYEGAVYLHRGQQVRNSPPSLFFKAEPSSD